MKTMKSEDKNTKVHPAKNLIKRRVGRAGDRKKKILQLDLKALRTILYQPKSTAKPGKRREL